MGIMSEQSVSLKPIGRDYLVERMGEFLDILKTVPGEYWTREHFLSELNEKWTYSIAAERDNKLIGYIIASRKQDALHIHKFMVSERYRSIGVGNALLSHLECIAKRKSDRRITLKVSKDNESGVRFYRHHGFAVHTQDGASLLMEKNLGRTVAIHQPNFLPWIGFFHKMAHSDTFVLFDDVQVPTGKSPASRVLIKTNTGGIWITVPVLARDQRKTYRDLEVAESNWALKMLKTLRFAYQKAPFFDTYYKGIELIVLEKHKYLFDLNYPLITFTAQSLGLDTQVVLSSRLCRGVECNGEEKILHILKELGASEYLSGVGKGSKRYINPQDFEDSNIKLTWQNFQHRVYPQLHGSFIPSLSIIDLMFNCGNDARKYLVER